MVCFWGPNTSSQGVWKPRVTKTWVEILEKQSPRKCHHQVILWGEFDVQNEKTQQTTNTGVITLPTQTLKNYRQILKMTKHLHCLIPPIWVLLKDPLQQETPKNLQQKPESGQME